MVITRQITLDTRGNGDIADITGEVAEAVAASEITIGTVTVFIAGSTAGVTTVEYEPGLVADLQELWERVAPSDIEYQHNRRWHDGNGHSHVRASLLGASLTVPFEKKSLILGTWQQIVVVDFDNRARSRQVILQIIGDN
ncbi:MAG TPA: YjbQ family protein [Dehalococcoidia bacterium]|nr:YjbQ family protein [Dehalococcoidia bacterium]